MSRFLSVTRNRSNSIRTQFSSLERPVGVAGVLPGIFGCSSRLRFPPQGARPRVAKTSPVAEPTRSRIHSPLAPALGMTIIRISSKLCTSISAYSTSIS